MYESVLSICVLVHEHGCCSGKSITQSCIKTILIFSSLNYVSIQKEEFLGKFWHRLLHGQFYVIKPTWETCQRIFDRDVDFYLVHIVSPSRLIVL